MIERLEGTFWGYQDVELYYQVWRPASANGTIVVTHGIAEHSDCYQKTAEDIAKLGYQVFVWDLRGHGRSEGKRGYVNRFQDYCDDLDAAVRHIKAQLIVKGKPLFLFGHSMGGLITLKTLLNHAPSGVAAVCLSSPALGLSLKVPEIKKRGAVLLAEWAPKFTLHNEINFEDLVRDSALVRQYKADPLRHDKISPRLFLGMLEAFDEVKKSAGEFHLPMLMQLAGREKVVSSAESEKFFDQVAAKDKKIFIYADSLHEIFNDYDREEVIKDLVQFLSEVTNEK